MPVVTLSTLHAAKGLEWDEVFIVALAEGSLPFQNSNVDEELRLFYVGITRASRKLHLSYAGQPSRFLSMIIN